MKTLFAFEGWWAPYSQRWLDELPRLADQGWDGGELGATLLELLRTGDPTVQQTLQRRVERLARSRGFGGVYEGWRGEIERVTEFRFDRARRRTSRRR